MLKQIKFILSLTCLSAAALGMGACSKQEFKKLDFQSSSQGAGSRTIPAKVDIVIAVDNSASITRAYDIIQNQFNGFAQELQNQYWDYHMVRVLIADQASDNESVYRKILVNPNFNSVQLPDGSPSPGADGLVSADAAVTNPNDFKIIDSSELTNQNGQIESAYTKVYNTLLDARLGFVEDNGFLREDALLVVIVVTNGVDATVYNFDTLQTQVYEPDPATPTVNNHAVFEEDSVQGWSTLFRSLKDKPDQFLRFYPIVSNGARPRFEGDNCLTEQGAALDGGSYKAMNNFIKGTSIDFCSESAMLSALSIISGDLKLVKEKYIVSYIVLNSEPSDKLVITKNGGILTEDDFSNGWSYLGCGITVPTITGIIRDNGTEEYHEADFRTGCVVELYGNGRIKGNEPFGVDLQKP